MLCIEDVLDWHQEEPMPGSKDRIFDLMFDGNEEEIAFITLLASLILRENRAKIPEGYQLKMAYNRKFDLALCALYCDLCYVKKQLEKRSIKQSILNC